MGFAALQMDADVQSQEEDFIPSGGGFVLDTGLYPMIIENAYFDKSRGGAMSANLHLKIKGGDKRVFKETIYITSKAGKPFYVKDGKKFPLPGYSTVDQICKIACDTGLGQIGAEKKLVKIYDYDAGKEMPREVPVLTDLIGQEVLIGLQKRRENKRVQSGNEWVDGPEEKVYHEINKAFYPSGHTVTEKKAEGDAEFIEKWKEANPDNYVRDTYKKVEAAGTPGAPAANAAASTAAAAPDDLFDD